MTLEEYAKEASQLESFTDDRLDHAVTGMSSEVGELSDLRKKAMTRGFSVNQLDVADECGDILYYVQMALSWANVSMEEVMAYNIAKLKRRRLHGKDKLAERGLLLSFMGRE